MTIKLRQRNIKINLNNYDKDSFKKFFKENKKDKKYFKRIGSGVNRNVYSFKASDNKYYVIKEKKNRNKIIEGRDMSHQNLAEINFFCSLAEDKDLQSLLAPIVLCLSDEDIVIMRKATPFEFGVRKEPELPTEWLLSFNNFKDQRIPFNNIYMACRVTNTDFESYVENLDKLWEYGLDLEDLYLSNLGELNGKLVIIDYGLIEERGKK